MPEMSVLQKKVLITKLLRTRPITRKLCYHREDRTMPQYVLKFTAVYAKIISRPNSIRYVLRLTPKMTNLAICSNGKTPNNQVE